MGERRSGVREALSDSDVLGSLTDPELDRLIPYGVVQTHRSGEVIFQKGDPGESLMVVLKGRVKIGSVSIDGRESPPHLHRAGRQLRRDSAAGRQAA